MRSELATNKFTETRPDVGFNNSNNLDNFKTASDLKNKEPYQRVDIDKPALRGNTKFGESYHRVDLDKPAERGQFQNDEIGRKSEIGNQGEKYYTSYKERIDYTPKDSFDRGYWEGERGESKYVSNNEETNKALKEYGMDGVSYKDGIPDFSKCSEATVKIDNMTGQRRSNFEQCDNKCAELWNKEKKDGRTDWTARDVTKWRRDNGYSWHELNDMKTCQLVDGRIHSFFKHIGGVAECNRRDGIINAKGVFDD